MLIGNFNKAGWNNFISHEVDKLRPEYTLCGLEIDKLRGDWQEVEANEPSCKNCLKRLVAPDYRLAALLKKLE